MSSAGYQTNATLAQLSPLMDSVNHLYSTSYNNYTAFWYTVDAIPTDFCEGDFDVDQDVDALTLATYAGNFCRTDCTGDCDGDVNGDGEVDGSDLATFAADFKRTD